MAILTAAAGDRLNPVAADWQLRQGNISGFGKIGLLPTPSPIPNPLDSIMEQARQRERQRAMAMAAAQRAANQRPVLGPPVPTPSFTGEGEVPQTQTGIPALGPLEGVGISRPSAAMLPQGGMGTDIQQSLANPAAAANENFMSVPSTPSEMAIAGQVPPIDITDSDALRKYGEERLPEIYGELQRQSYGDPEVINGQLVYPNEMVMYYGITGDEQATGYLAIKGRPDKIPGPDATLEEQIAYNNKLSKMFVAPQYKIGSDADILRGMTRSDIRNLQKSMAQAGLYEDDQAIYPGVMSGQDRELFQLVLGEANKTGYDYTQVLAMRAEAMRKYRLREQRRAGGGGDGGGGDVTRQVNVQYSQTSIAQGRTMLIAVLQNALGRPPTSAELGEFMTRLNNAESKSPTRTVTNYVREGSTTRSTSRTTPSGVDPNQMAREFASEIGGGDEMAGYKATRFMDRLINRLIGAQNV